jgi:phosphoesterase RecJ-like protein
LDEPVPAKLDFLPELARIEAVSAELTDELIRIQTIALLIDCADTSRIGQRRQLGEAAPQICALDHHQPALPLQSGQVVDTTAAATGELVFDLIGCLEKELGRTLLTRPVAMLLMTAIISDTGGFVFSNTTSRTFRTAASLMDGDLDLRQITYRLFSQSSPGRLRLMGRIFSEARFSHNDRVILASVDSPLLEACQATDEDLDGVITHLRNVAGVELAFLIRRQRDGLMRVNIRSSDRINAARLAGRFGGGGHAKAAGMHISGLTLPETEAALLAAAEEWF